MSRQLVARWCAGALLTLSFAIPGRLPAQASAPGRALAAVGEAMFFRRSALGDSLRFDACSVYECTGRPATFPEGILPGLRPLLDRPVAEPCAVPAPGAGSRHPRVVRVDSVVIADSTARVRLHVRRGEWTYDEVYHLAARPSGDGWALCEVRMYPPIQTMPPPPRQR
jgi:hypothetical protein